MRTLLFIFAIFLLQACSEERNNNFLGQKKDTSASINDKTIINQDSSTYSEYVSPDGSWEVSLNIKEGFFWGYTIIYKDGKTITKKVNNNLEIIGGVDYSNAIWINNETYQIPNIGGTSTGYFELIIYKDASCKYIEHFSEKFQNEEVQDTSLSIEESTIDNDKKKEPQIINSYSQTDNFIVFTQTIKNFGDTKVGCSSNESTLSIVIQNYTDSFEYENDVLSTIKLNYSYSGGLYDIIGDKPIKGYLKGILLDDNTWKLEMDLWISTFNYADNEKGKRQIKTSGIFKP